MAERQMTLLWLKDLLEHMNQCHEQLHYAEDTSSEHYLADTMLHDLSQCRRLCESLRQRAGALMQTTA